MTEPLELASKPQQQQQQQRARATTRRSERFYRPIAGRMRAQLLMPMADHEPRSLVIRHAAGFDRARALSSARSAFVKTIANSRNFAIAGSCDRLWALKQLKRPNFDKDRNESQSEANHLNEIRCLNEANESKEMINRSKSAHAMLRSADPSSAQQQRSISHSIVAIAQSKHTSRQ